MNSTILLLCITVIVTCLDQLSKYFVYTFMELGESIPVIEGFFHITYLLNDGMAFGQMGNARWVFMSFTPLALIGVACYLLLYEKLSKDKKKLSMPIKISLCLIFAGGFSNMIDRIFFYKLSEDSKGLFDGRVVDFIDFRGIWEYIFNIADAAAVIGVIAFMLFFILEEIKSYKAEKAKKAAKEAAKKADEAENAEIPQENSNE